MQRQDITIYLNGSFEFDFLWVDENGDPVPLTGWTGELKVADDDNGNNVRATWNGSKVVLTDGKIAVDAVPADTVLIPKGKRFYQLVLTHTSSGFKVPVFYGLADCKVLI